MKPIIKEFESSVIGKKVGYYVYKPQGEIKAIIQISHGMVEYIGRYNKLAEFLNEKGIMVVGNDHLGHGITGDLNNEFGFFDNENGDEKVVEDLHKLTTIIKAEYGELPYILLGHSMGSFIARQYLEKYHNDLTGCILSGTTGKNNLSSVGVQVSNLIISAKGSNYVSKLVDNLAIGTYNRKFNNSTNEVLGVEWLTRDKEVCKEYKLNPYCNFKFSTSAYKDVFKLITNINKNKWFKEIPKKFPIYIISGDMDPVGNYGKGVNQFYNKLIKTGHNDITIKLYKDGRHEMLNEINKEEVFLDLLQWIEKRI